MNLQKTLYSVGAVFILLFSSIAVFPAWSQAQVEEDDQSQQQEAQQIPDFYTAVSMDPNLNAFALAVKESNFSERLSTGGPYTVFAPSDDAVKSISMIKLQSLVRDRDDLSRLLENHVVSGEITPNDIGRSDITTLGGERIELSRDGETATVNGHKVIGGARFNNGVVYVVDGLLNE